MPDLSIAAPEPAPKPGSAPPPDVGVTASAASDLLAARGAAGIEHLGSDLLTHLQGTASLLRSWGAAEDVVLAGLCHATYGTDGFAPRLLTLEERPMLRDVLGERAEQFVYDYASCDLSLIHI